MLSPMNRDWTRSIGPLLHVRLFMQGFCTQQKDDAHSQDTRRWWLAGYRLRAPLL